MSKSKREKILQKAEELFLKNGIQSVSMDEIAAAVPVAKMTLYNHFRSKEGLLDHVIDRILHHMIEECNQLIDTAKTPLDGLIALTKHEMVHKMSGQFLSDLVNYYPHLRERMQEVGLNYLHAKFEELIFKGQQFGQFRKEYSPHVVVLYSLALKEGMSNPKIFGKITDITAITEQIYGLFLHGLVDPEYHPHSE